jgi:hypothetical protein
VPSARRQNSSYAKRPDPRRFTHLAPQTGQLIRSDDAAGAIVFREACAFDLLELDGKDLRRRLGCEGIVSKRLGSIYRRGRSPLWIKVKNPAAPAVKREAEEDWGLGICRYDARISVAAGEHRRATITCLAASTPPLPTRLKRLKRRSRCNRESSWHRPIAPAARSQLLVRHHGMFSTGLCRSAMSARHSVVNHRCL